MAYGHEIYNESGNLVFSSGEKTFMYYGKVSFTKSGTTNPGGTFSTVKLFDIASTVDIVIFITSPGYSSGTTKNGGGNMFPEKDNGKWRVTGDTGNPNGNYDIYVFVEPDSILRGSYGLEVYDTDGTIQYHHSRQPLGLIDVIPQSSGTVNYGFTPATPVILTGTAQPVGGDLYYVFRAASTISNRVTDHWIRVATTGPISDVAIFSGIQCPVIDGTHYSGIANLGDWDTEVLANRAQFPDGPEGPYVPIEIPLVLEDPLTPTPRALAQSYESGSASASFGTYTDGTWVADENGNNSFGGNSGDWKISGNASDIQVRYTPTSGTFSTNSASTWTTITGTLFCTVSRSSANGTKSCTFTVEYRLAAAPNTILSTTTGCFIQADSRPGGIPLSFSSGFSNGFEGGYDPGFGPGFNEGFE